jgi:hypothetical protein
VIGMRFRHARGHGADADLGHQLHADARLGINVLQIVNQLRQIFDGINIVCGGGESTTPGGIAELAMFSSTLAGNCRLRASRPAPS